MSNVLVEKNKLDLLANAIAGKSGEPLKLTLDEMVEAVDGIKTEFNLQEKQHSVNKAGQELIHADDGYDGLSNVIVNTPSGSATGPTADYVSTNYSPFKRNNGFAISTTGVPTTPIISAGYISGGTPSNRKVTISTVIPYDPTPTVSGNTVTIPSGFYPSQRTATVPGETPNLQDKTVTPTTSQQTVNADSGYDGLDTVTVNAMPNGTLGTAIGSWSKDNSYIYTRFDFPNFVAGYLSSVNPLSISQRLQDETITPSTISQTVTPNSNGYYLNSVTVNAMPSGTAGTPTATKGTVSNHSVSVTPSVTNTTGYITGSTINGTAVSVSASELVSGTLSVTSAGTKDVTNYASASIPSGTEGTPTATKGTVSNHSVSVTPSVTNTTGYITGGTKNGTAVTVSASELVSGSETKTQNGTYDVTNLAEIVVDVQGGGSSGVQAAVATPQSGANSYVTFGNLEGIPTSFSLINAYDITIDDTPIVSALTFDGTNYVGQLATILSNANAHAMSTGFSHSYDSHYNQINISSENAVFDTYNHYVLVYTYGGSASDIHTADVQVGSGATSITFPVTGRPTQWSCVFKSDFGTSSGYQRTIAVANDGTNAIGTYGLCLDSSVHASNTYWTASYSGGNFTISSQSTNAGGYFHQPGYYQLTYIVDESAPSYQTKTVTPTTSQQVVSPDSGFDALSQVTVNAIPSQYIIPSGNLAITENGNNINVSQYATVSVNVSGGGGSSTCDTKTMTNSNDQATSIQFTGLSGQPKWFFVRCTAQMSRSSSYSYYYITAVRYNGTNHYGNYWRRSNGTFYNDTTHYSHTYSNGTLTVSSSASRGAAGGSFYNGSYELVYIY